MNSDILFIFLQSFSINTSEAMDLLDQFCAMNPDSK